MKDLRDQTRDETRSGSQGHNLALTGLSVPSPRKVDVRLPGKGNSKLPWRKAGPPNHHDDKVDSDQLVVNKELSLARQWGGAHDR